jgi:DNA-binding SARP family transcriptional activator
LWGECPTSQSKKYLRQTLWQLQKALASLSEIDREEIVLHSDSECVRVEPRDDLWFDVRIFEKAFAPIQGIAGENIDERCAQNLRKAVGLYEGNLLEGWYQEWCLYHRERLENNYLAMLDKLMAYCECHKDYEAGVAFGERLLRQDCARERTYYRLMRLHYLAGDRAGALRQFQRCKEALQDELGVEPARRTMELYEQIRSDKLEVQAAGPSAPKQLTGNAANGFPEALPLIQRLRRIRSALLRIQQRVQRDIREVDTVLRSHVDSSPSEKQ